MSFDFPPGMILHRMMGLWFSVAVLMCLLNVSISLSIKEAVIVLGVAKFMFESFCLYCSLLALLNCSLGRIRPAGNYLLLIYEGLRAHFSTRRFMP